MLKIKQTYLREVIPYNNMFD